MCKEIQTNTFAGQLQHKETVAKGQIGSLILQYETFKPRHMQNMNLKSW